ncbi:hypothetical protein PpBr36_01882 [Pyricularia pennisetigena]|uniref:hypothetical protein n=1 Tax=Pyricularia pennisetigena TaxID=1578925 RepID=UPI0011520113|nr:hypothetical protein PpBr36_01882 [Pyricularia pennisetigena]TLS28640.1 hypothetical protein PpBr36_01882 [Pyricularia pennisetigena]
MAILKRKRSESELSFSSQLSSPPRPGDAYFAFPVTPIGLSFSSTRSSNPSHLNSRTIKRHRDNRPSENEVHQHTLELLYSARDVPSEHLQQVQQRAHYQPPASFASTQHQGQQQTSATRQTSLHSFWNLPRTSSKAPTMMPSFSPSTDLGSTSCEDCGSSLRSDDGMMDVDGDGCGGAEACGCNACGKVVCFSCSVGNLGEHRRCLMSAIFSVRSDAGLVLVFAHSAFFPIKVSLAVMATGKSEMSDNAEKGCEPPPEEEKGHETLKYSLLGPSLLKAGQDSVDQTKVYHVLSCFIFCRHFPTYKAKADKGQVSEIIYNASKNSKFFLREEQKDKILTEKIARIQAKKARLDKLDLSRDLRLADAYIAERELSRDLSQVVVHVDCDAFYAAVEQLDRPELAHVPFAVGGGVLTTCNYVARTFGCRSGMAGFVAKKLCPDLVFIKPNFEKYTAKAQEVRKVLAKYDPRFESASIDEAYLNITQYCAENGLEPGEVVEQMRREVHLTTNITVSSGVAANSKLAKICGNINKPNGQYVLPSDRSAIMEFMRDLPCRKVNGIGRVLERELQAVGVSTCGDIYPQRKYLTQLFGEKAFKFLVDCYLGLGRTNIQPAEEYERKSVGTESTFSSISEPGDLRKKLRRTAEELEKDMKRAEVKGRTLVIKIKLHTFEVYTRQVILPRSIHLAEDLYNFSLPMLARLEKEKPGFSCRLMGLRCTNLVSTKKPDTAAFFGLRTHRSGSGEADVVVAKDGVDETSEEAGFNMDEEEWEQWPEEEFGEGVEVNHQERELYGPSPYLKNGRVVLPNPKPAKDPPPEEELWDCPICARPQTANEREFNEHIDMCLSRQAIRETVQQEARKPAFADESSASETRRAKQLPERKRGRPPKNPDPKQKKIRFG